MKTRNLLFFALIIMFTCVYAQQSPKIFTSFIGSGGARVGFPFNNIGVNIQNYNRDTTYFALIQVKCDNDININDISFSKPKYLIHLMDSISYGNTHQFTFLITNISPNRTKSIYFQFDFSNNNNSPQKFSYGLLVLSNINIELSELLLETTKNYWEDIASKDEVKQVITNSIYIAYTNLNNRWKGNEKPIKMFCEELSSLLNSFLQSKGSIMRLTGKIIYSNVESIFDGKTKNINNLVLWDNKEEKYNTIGTIFYKSLQISRLVSHDPNEKINTLGFGVGHFINKNDFITYRINFENKNTSTAPAYRIVITDTLSELLDPSTVKFIGTSHDGERYKWNISQDGRILKWQIDSIELPPNSNPPEGEGYVEFLVKPIDNILHNTEITNKATIIFDLNAPITTNTVFNKIDIKSPETKLYHYFSNDQKYAIIKWVVDEQESGYAATNLYISKNNSNFSFFGTFNNDSLVINLDSLSSFDIYASSMDCAGNIESKSNIIRINKNLNSVSNITPSEIELFQNYPNPFNPTTNIKYSISEGGIVQIKLYDILGKEVKTILNKYQNPGTYNIEFDGSNYNSGVYYYQIKTNNYSKNKKMVLIK